MLHAEAFFHYTTQELVLMGVIALLLITILLLLAYAFILRIGSNRRNAYYTLREEVWEKTLLKYLGGEYTQSDIDALAVTRRDWLRFAEFIENYLVDLTGEDYDSIVELLKKIHFEELLTKALDNADQWERAYSAYFLGLMRCYRAEGMLHRLVYDSSPIVSIIAFESLNRIGSRKDLYNIITFVLKNSTISISKVFDIILNYGDAVNQELIGILSDPNVSDNGKRLVLDVIAALNVVESLPAVRSLAYRTQNQEVIIGCIKALGVFGGPESLDFLMAHLSSPNWVIRSQSVRALGNISSPMIIPELKIRIRTDSNYWVRLYSAQAIKKFGALGEKELKSILSLDPKKEVASIVNFVLYESEV